MTTRAYGSRKLDRLFGIGGRTAEIMFAAAMAVLILHWLLVFSFVVSRLGSLGFLKLHYTAALGVDWIAGWWNVFLYPGFGLVVLLVNALLSGRLYRSQPVLGLTVLGSTVFLQVVCAVGGGMSLLLNA